MKKPCTNCRYANKVEYRGGKIKRWDPNFMLCGRGCEKYLQYLEYLESKRNYQCGKTICSVEELIACCEKSGFVYWRHKILHKGFIYSWQLHLIMNSIKAGVFKEAVRKPRDDAQESDASL